MGVARLLAKGWIAFCLFTGAHAMALALKSGLDPLSAFQEVGLCTVLLGAMGLLFIGGYAASASHSGMAALADVKLHHLLPGFDEIVFIAFAVAVFAVQVFYAPAHSASGAVGALQGAIRIVVPGQQALENVLGGCSLDSGRILSSAFAWIVALIFLGSALSRIRMEAALVRLERKGHPEIFGASALVLALGVAAVVGIQLLYMGSVYSHVSCRAFAGLPGSVLIGLGPLMLAYLIKVALTDLLALGPEG